MFFLPSRLQDEFRVLGFGIWRALSNGGRSWEAKDGRGGAARGGLARVDDMATGGFDSADGRICALVWAGGCGAGGVGVRCAHAGEICRHDAGEYGGDAAAVRVCREPGTEDERGGVGDAGLRVARRDEQWSCEGGVGGAGEGAAALGGGCVHGGCGRGRGRAGLRDGEACEGARTPRTGAGAAAGVAGRGRRHGAAGVPVPHAARRAVRGHEAEPRRAHGGRAPAAPPRPARGARSGTVL